MDKNSSLSFSFAFVVGTLRCEGDTSFSNADRSCYLFVSFIFEAKAQWCRVSFCFDLQLCFVVEQLSSLVVGFDFPYQVSDWVSVSLDHHTGYKCLLIGHNPWHRKINQSMNE